jgi:hypothetical protein
LLRTIRDAATNTARHHSSVLPDQSTGTMLQQNAILLSNSEPRNNTVFNVKQTMPVVPVPTEVPQQPALSLQNHNKRSNENK